MDRHPPRPSTTRDSPIQIAKELGVSVSPGLKIETWGTLRLYGEAGHTITISNPAVPNIVLQYNSFRQITGDISDARVYGGIHFRTDQDAGAVLDRLSARQSTSITFVPSTVMTGTMTEGQPGQNASCS